VRRPVNPGKDRIAVGQVTASAADRNMPVPLSWISAERLWAKPCK
jgi:hypothetical protein